MLVFLAEPLPTPRAPRWVDDSGEQDTGTCDMTLGCAFSQQRLPLEIFIVLVESDKIKMVVLYELRCSRTLHTLI